MQPYSPSSTVYLVGAGPGDPELITLRGLRLLRRADVVVYDRLVHPALLDEAPAGAERLFVGKAPDRHVCSQEAINALLISKARTNRCVVRLKGGDPFVFGRGGEEALALERAGIAFEVVPGISSAIGVPAYAGIPVTHRGVSTAFTVVTGHTGAAADEPDWEGLARTGTLVILMGLGRLPQIAARLMAGGRAPETPVAVICDGTTGQQTVVEGTLRDIGARTRALAPPATIVVGDVVALRRQLAWHASEPSATFAPPPVQAFPALWPYPHAIPA